MLDPLEESPPAPHLVLSHLWAFALAVPFPPVFTSHLEVEFDLLMGQSSLLWAQLCSVAEQKGNKRQGLSLPHLATVVTTSLLVAAAALANMAVHSRPTAGAQTPAVS